MATFTREQWEDGGLRVVCAPRPWAGDVAIYLMQVDKLSSRIAKFSAFSDPVIRGELLPPEPSFELPEAFAKNLMDELWRAGVRPSEHGIGGDAQRSHLEDMRSLLFAKLGVERPK